MAAQIIGQQAPSLGYVSNVPNGYMSNVFGPASNSLDGLSTSKLRSAEPVAVQQYRKVQRMVDTMKVCCGLSRSLTPPPLLFSPHSIFCFLSKLNDFLVNML